MIDDAFVKEIAMDIDPEAHWQSHSMDSEVVAIRKRKQKEATEKAKVLIRKIVLHVNPSANMEFS